MSGKLIWNPIKKQYEEKAKEIVKSNNDSYDLDNISEVSGEPEDYKYTDADLERELNRFGNPSIDNAKKRKIIKEEEEPTNDRKEKLQFLYRELKLQRIALLSLIKQNEKLKEIVNNIN